MKNKTSVIIITIFLVVVISLVIFNFTKKNNNNSTDIPSKSSDVKFVKNEVSNLTLEEYTNDALTMKKPKGWVVETGGSGIYYAIRVYDPSDSRNQVFLMLKVQPLLKSDASKSFWQNYYNMS